MYLPLVSLAAYVESVLTPPTQTTDKMCFRLFFCIEKDCGNEHGVICLLHHNAGALQLNEIKHRPLKEEKQQSGLQGALS